MRLGTVRDKLVRLSLYLEQIYLGRFRHNRRGAVHGFRFGLGVTLLSLACPALAISVYGML